MSNSNGRYVGGGGIIPWCELSPSGRVTELQRWSALLQDRCVGGKTERVSILGKVQKKKRKKFDGISIKGVLIPPVLDGKYKVILFSIRTIF